MSKHTSQNETPGESVTVETGLEALRSSPAFRGPAAPLDDHDHANDHFALIYDSREEQLAAAIPFIRQGLERGERCLYITHENSRDEIVAAMRAFDIDVDAALASGQLSVHDEDETYLRNGTFDADETIEFIDAAIAEATEEYEALRVTGEMSSVLREDPDCEELVKCEAKANYLFDDVDGLALCQYSRERFPPEVIRDVISTHPLLVHDSRVSHNVYYTPPEEFFSPEKSEREVDRLLGTLREQTDAKAALKRRERFLRRSYQITSDPTLDFEEKLEHLLDLGCERFGLELGGVATVDREADRLEVEHVSGDYEGYEPGLELQLSETYCAAAVEADEEESIVDPVAAGYDDRRAYRDHGFETYLGTTLDIEGGRDRTFFFLSEESRDAAFSEAERTFLDLMGQWAAYELEHRRRERELRERTEHLSALVETTPECIKTVVADGTLLQMNPAGLHMVGADSDSDVIGKSVYDLIAPEHRELFREFNERICRGERGTLEFDIVGQNGTRRHMETHATPLRHPDGTTSHVALTRDITEQVERERELERALDLLEKTERIADVGGWEIDTQTMDVFWSDHIFELLGTSVDEEPSLDEALDMYHEEDRQIVEGAIEAALDSGDPFDVEARLRTDGGEVRWLRLQGVPETVDEEVVSLRGAAQDITERKEREQRLEEVIDRLEASNERLEQFAYAASHDLQEPLRMVSTYLRLLERRYEDALDEDGEEFLEFAVNGADRMREMIEALLAYSRVETQGDPLEPVDLDAILDDVLSDIQVQIAEYDAEVTVDDLPRVAGDASQLRQVFQNLLENGITYSGDDPPRIEITAERSEALDASERSSAERSSAERSSEHGPREDGTAAEDDGAEWIVSVRDEGIGIDPDDQDRIFEVFQRLHTHGEYDGTGIGLALCERIVERHGGEIRIDSEPGEGTTVSVTLPAVQAHDD
ncbi:MEDS domain-containing protein [Halosolutus halophilus]|uniref:MEDS domain-containing protein n=1 Tax=Halosolutus halophilus TaxID=1552990 RepID=UPI002A5A3821|nr:MEDS domain-containing protein [Halosolutus halophilus]